MGTLAAHRIGPDLIISITAGTDSLSLQRFQAMSGGHLTGHHPAQIVLQLHFIDHPNALIAQCQFYTSFVIRDTITAL